MSNSNYKFVNPHIEGDFKNLFSGKNHIDAARTAWEKLSANFTNNLPQFAFTLEKVGDGKLYHFLVKEKITNGSVTYKINGIELNPIEINRLREKISVIQLGGRRKKDKNIKITKVEIDDDDDELDLDDEDELDDSDSDDMYNMIRYGKRITGPIKYWMYDPIAYARFMETFYTPNFIVPITPYVEICMPPCLR